MTTAGEEIVAPASLDLEEDAWEEHLDEPSFDQVLGARIRAMTWAEKDPQIAMEEALKVRRTILDEDRMFNSITVRFRGTWERDKHDPELEQRVASCEELVREFLLEF